MAGGSGEQPPTMEDPPRMEQPPRMERPPRMVVVKVGTSSLTDATGIILQEALGRLAAQVGCLTRDGHRIVLVSSGAIAAGLGALEMERPEDTATLQALSAVGQHRLMQAWDAALADVGLVAGQVLLAPLDFGHRQQYLHARSTLNRLMELGVVPIVNENDAVADDEIRFGDNDRLAALVSHLVRADLLVLLTDAPGLLSADPRSVPGASLVEEVLESDHSAALEMAAGPGTERGSGGMSSKVAAARMAAWSGVRCLIAAADRPGVLQAALVGSTGVGTQFPPRPRRLPARKVWLAFAVPSRGTVTVDDGARQALVAGGRSLLPAGVLGVSGVFGRDDAVEVAAADGAVFAKGFVGHPSALVAEWAGRQTSQLPRDARVEVIHRDDMVLLGDEMVLLDEQAGRVGAAGRAPDGSRKAVQGEVAPEPSGADFSTT
ncbi:MAG: glutamate 5-kinase [Actinomycetota bacterium]|nr:glutamate 5-kinase [Actinomycetota bacterium]